MDGGSYLLPFLGGRGLPSETKGIFYSTWYIVSARLYSTCVHSVMLYATETGLVHKENGYNR